MSAELELRLRSYYATAVISLVFAVVGFSYNAWRLELSEDNNNIRTAAFSMLQELAELEHIVFARHYDRDLERGNPRAGWVKVGLIADLSLLVDTGVQERADTLRQVWAQNWSGLGSEQAAVEAVGEAIDGVRAAIKARLAKLS